MIQAIKQIIEKQLREAGVSGTVELSVPPKSDMGDFAFPCFALAKEQGKKPNEVASDLVSRIKNQESRIVEKTASFGPYVNFFLKPGAVAELVIEAVQEKAGEYGTSDLGKGQKVMIEYPSNNTHKEFHVGHLRNVCIGNPLVQLYRARGYEVHPVNYLNDFGAHVARCLWGLLNLHKEETPPENKQKWLGEIYAEASSYLKEHEEKQVEVAEIQKKLEAHDPEIMSLFSETREWSIEQFNEIFKELGVRHDAVFAEKDIKEKGQRVVDKLLEQGIAQIGEGGAVIVDLSNHKLEIALVRKSNGSGLYLTADLALSQEKFNTFDVDESIVITANEQNFSFRQLFKILELLGNKKKLTHISYGLITRPEGKMSSRLGNVILYEDLRDEVYTKFLEETTNRHPEWNTEQLHQTAHTLTMAALKFDMQKHEASKNIVFDIKEATSFEGFSAPYILYVVARINSLVRKSEIEELSGEVHYDALNQAEEKKLVLMMAEYEGVITKALEQYNPSVIARYCFDLAQAFNDFYNKHSILNAQGTALVRSRLVLAQAVQQVLKNALNLLTIGTVGEM